MLTSFFSLMQIIKAILIIYLETLDFICLQLCFYECTLMQKTSTEYKDTYWAADLWESRDSVKVELLHALLQWIFHLKFCSFRIN